MKGEFMSLNQEKLIRLFKTIALSLFAANAYAAKANEAFPEWEDYVANVETKQLQSDDVFELHPDIDKVYLALGWDPARGHDSIDIDSNIHVLKNNKISKRISYSNSNYTTGKFGSVKLIEHKGDNLTGEGEGDDETIVINLKKIAKNKRKITDLVGSIVSYSGHTFDKLSNAFCRIYIIEKGQQKELARFSLNDLGPVQGLVFASFHRSHDGSWSFKAIGETTDRARVASSLDSKIIELKRTSQL